MDEALIVTQIGLIFSQVRNLRMAIEQVERNTSRYAGIALDAAFAGPGGFGAPPMFEGSLRVHVVNIGDLIAADNSFMGFLGGIFRGISSIAGGFVAGVVNAFTLPVTLGLIGKITGDAVQILRLLGTSSGSSGTSTAGSGERAPSGLMAMLDKIERVAQQLREVLGLVDRQQQSTEPVQSTPESRGWLDALRAVSRIVDGLIILVPILIGAFASLLVKIDQLKIGILDMLEFAVRNVLLLRGVILVTLADTAAMAARLAASLLTIIGTAIGSILNAVFRMIESALTAVTSAFEALSTGLAAVINSLLPWLVNTVLITLRNLGELRVFKMIFALVEILPSVLPAMFDLLGRPLSSSDVTALEAARTRMVTSFSAATTGTLAALPTMPDFAALPAVRSALATTTTSIMGAATSMGREVSTVFRGASGAMSSIASTLDATVGPHGEGLTRSLTDRLGGVVSSATTLTDSLRTARTAAEAGSGMTGLEEIAHAYERWLGEGGMDQVLTRITDHFATASRGPNPEASILGRVSELAGSVTAAIAGNVEPPRPTVEIPEVVVEVTIAQPAPAPPPPGPSSLMPNPYLVGADEDELIERGMVRMA